MIRLPREKLADLVPLAREGSVDEDRVEDSVQRIKRYLNQQGYWKADASAAREEGDGTLTIVFTIRTGAQYVSAEGVEIDGNRSVPIEQLRPALVKLQAERRLRGIQPERRSQCDRRGRISVSGTRRRRSTRAQTSSIRRRPGRGSSGR